MILVAAQKSMAATLTLAKPGAYYQQSTNHSVSARHSIEIIIFVAKVSRGLHAMAVEIDVGSLNSAAKAMSFLDTMIEAVNSTRAILGALACRLG
jgi:hypothetical protein